MSPDTSQPQTGLTLREQVALALARCADNTWAQADAVIPLVAKAQREADVDALRQRTEAVWMPDGAPVMFGERAANVVGNLPLISERGHPWQRGAPVSEDRSLALEWLLAEARYRVFLHQRREAVLGHAHWAAPWDTDPDPAWCAPA